MVTTIEASIAEDAPQLHAAVLGNVSLDYVAGTPMRPEAARLRRPYGRRRRVSQPAHLFGAHGAARDRHLRCGDDDTIDLICGTAGVHRYRACCWCAAPERKPDPRPQRRRRRQLRVAQHRPSRNRRRRQRGRRAVCNGRCADRRSRREVSDRLLEGRDMRARRARVRQRRKDPRAAYDRRSQRRRSTRSRLVPQQPSALRPTSTVFRSQRFAAAPCSQHDAGGVVPCAGRPEATYLMERLMDIAARRLGLDPVESAAVT